MLFCIFCLKKTPTKVKKNIQFVTEKRNIHTMTFTDLFTF